MSKGSATKVGGKLVVGVVLAGVTLALLLLNPGLGQAEEWEMLVNDIDFLGKAR